MEIEFHGAAQSVTGSMHLLHTGRGVVAMDCGLFQGSRALARERNEMTGVPVGDIVALLLSHAHTDHSGNLPQLVKRGYKGPIYATTATADLCALMLADSAKIQEEDARYWNEKCATAPADRIEPLYTLDDASRAERLFRGLPYGTTVPVAPGCAATFLEAGHILGSAVVLIEAASSPAVRILYTGDLGRFGAPILRDPAEPLPRVDYLITESTYANARHESGPAMKAKLTGIINETRAAGGRVVIPAFSVGRTQTIVYFLRQAIEDGTLPRIPVYVDSPLSAGVTEVFRRHPECYDDEARAFLRREGDLFGKGLVTYVTDVEQSKRLNDLREPCVIIAASGMCESGRILHHLKHAIEDRRNTVIAVGYMAEDTLGRRIVERQPEVTILARTYRLNCRVEVLNDFSAHADADDFARLFAPIAPTLKAAFAVHGEAEQLEAMKALLARLGCRDVRAPEPGDKYPL